MVTQNASERIIRAAWKALAQEWHPDKHPNNQKEAERILKIINAAYDVLSNPATRKEHDDWIASQLDDASRSQDENYALKESDEEEGFLCYDFNLDPIADPIFDEVVKFVINSRQISIGVLQRHFQISYDRAARIISELERIEIISHPDYRGYSEVYVSSPAENENESESLINLVCPKCLKQGDYFIENFAEEAVCPYCRTSFTYWFTIVRAKRAQKARSKGKKQVYVLRVDDYFGQGHEIALENPGFKDFELNTGDNISLNYLNGELRLVHNCTTNQFMAIGSSGKLKVGFILLFSIFFLVVLALTINFYEISPNLLSYSEKQDLANQADSHYRDLPNGYIENKIAAKIENHNCISIDFYVENYLTTTLPPGSAKIIEISHRSSVTQLCLAGTSNCGNSFIVPWRDGMTYTIETDPVCRNSSYQFQE